MNIRQSIKKILKEESDRKSKIISMIKNQGFILTTRAVGGINHLAIILDETPEMLLTKYLSKETWIYTDQVILTLIYNDYQDMFSKFCDGYGMLIYCLY